MINNFVLLEEKVQSILKLDRDNAKTSSKQPFWTAFMESLQGVKDPGMRNTIFMHTFESMKYAKKLSEATTSGQVAGYNKIMLPTIIRRVMPQVTASKFVATHQLSVPTQIVQTFRPARATAKDGVESMAEFFDPSRNQRFPVGGATQWQGNKSAFDPHYSSHMIKGEPVQALASVELQHGPIIPGSLVFSQVSDADPRIRQVVAVHDGSPTVTIAGTVVTVDAGAFNAAKPSLSGLDAVVLPNLLDPADGVTVLPSHIEVDYSIPHERNKDISEITFKMDLIHVNATSRKNFAKISAEAIQDLEAYTDGKLDAIKELVTTMTETMLLEIDQELIMGMMAHAGKTAVWDAKYLPGLYRGTQAEFNQTLVHRMNFMANDMSVDYLRGDNFFAICHPHVYNILQNTVSFHLAGGDNSHQGEYSVGEAGKVGIVDQFQVSKTPIFPESDKMLIGYYSKELSKAPYAYFPYVTYLTPNMPYVRSGDIFSTVVGLQQRYDHKPLLDGSFGLGKLQVANLYQ